MPDPTITDADRAAAEEICPPVYGYPDHHAEHQRRAERVESIARIIARHRSEREKRLELIVAEWAATAKHVDEQSKRRAQAMFELETRIARLEQREKVLVEALRWYADSDNYGRSLESEDVSQIDVDGGEFARQALKGYEQ